MQHEASRTEQNGCSAAPSLCPAATSERSMDAGGAREKKEHGGRERLIEWYGYTMVWRAHQLKPLSRGSVRLDELLTPKPSPSFLLAAAASHGRLAAARTAG